MFDVCGEIVIVEPDIDTLKLTCCGDLEGGGCACPTETNPPEGCCGISCSNIDICADFQNVIDAIDSVWCECWQKSIDGEFVLEDSNCSRCTIPDKDDPDYGTYDIDALVNCSIKIPDGNGGYFVRTRSEIVAEVEAVWASCQDDGGGEEPVPPSFAEGSCLPECDRADECLTGALVCPDNQDVQICRSCGNPHLGCSSVRNPATTTLNNGIGLVAFESMEDNSVIQIHQFNSSVPAKILPNRRTNYGRLLHELKWDDSVGADTKLVKLYYYEDIADHFMNGVVDMLVFKNGPFENQCFSLHSDPVGTDETGAYVRFTVPRSYKLSNPFPSLDDVYNIEWFIMDSDDTGLTGSAIANSDTPGSQFLLPVSPEGPAAVNKILRLSPHIHDGAPVPVANPSITSAHNYMNALENSHYVYLTYQAFENQKWNVYLRQLRLSEYSREEQIDTAITEETSGDGGFTPLSELSINDLVYRAVCVNDECSIFGNDFIAKRTITLEVVLQDGRDVYNDTLLSSSNSWIICPGSPAGSYPQKKVFSELVHSVVLDQCPDQFEFNDIFYNWEVGDEFLVPFVDLSADQLFVLLKKANDKFVELGDATVVVGNISITSSQVGAVWFEDPSLTTWVALDSEASEDLNKFKGLDISNPIPITDFEEGHCTHPVIGINSNNDVFVTYECTDPEVHQIHVVGTAIPTTSFPIGIFNPKNLDANLDYFLSPKDFVYRSSATLSNEGINQLPDMYIDENDIIHLAWQSNRDNYWEIYYGNSNEGFQAKKITDTTSKSLKPSIDGDTRGHLFIVWHDNRFGNWEILMAYRDDERHLTLREQDPYLAGTRNPGYSHAFDIVPLNLINTSYTDPLCISNLIVRFYEDRLLDLAAFDVLQSEFPSAFQVPGMQDDRATSTWEYTEISWSLLVNETLYDKFGPAENSLDTALAGSEFDTVTMQFTIQPQFIRFLASPFPDAVAELESLQDKAISLGDDPLLLTTADTDWYKNDNNDNLWIQADHLTSEQEYSIPALAKDFFSTTAINLPSGRYKRIEILLNTGDSFDFSLVEAVSVVKNRICLAPRESVTGYVNLTPSIQVDPLGNEVTETPLPVAARKNIAYFVGLIGFKDDGQLHVFGDQMTSASCESCVADTSPWDSASCSLSVTFKNVSTSQETRFFNARVRFYADQEKLSLIAQFNAFKDSEGDLEYFTMDNNDQAQDSWKNAGLEVFFGKSRTVRLWPFLSNTAGLVCGITYWVEVETCNGDADTPCVRVDLENASFQKWVCQCSSTRWTAKFGEFPINIRDLVRWKSSGDGFSDTRLTETGQGVSNYNPQINIRSDLTGIVLYETNRDDPNRFANENNAHSIYATAFSIFPGSNMYATGAESIISRFQDLLVQSDIPITACQGTGCDDTGPAMEGRNPAFSLDQYDNIFLAVEKMNDQSLCEEFQLDKQRSILVHRCGAQAKNLAFTREAEDGFTGTEACNATEILGKIAPISQDKTFRQIIKLARVLNDFALYHITRAKKPAAVVEQCDIVIEVISEPDAVAVRLRNENDAWSTWYPFDPKIGDYTLQIPWRLSSASGVKSVTIEAATYQGLSTNAVLEVIADYKGVDHIIKFYKLKSSGTDTAPVPNVETTNTELINVLEENGSKAFVDENLLPQLAGLPVAGIRNPTVLVDGDKKRLVKQTGEYVFVEIVPSKNYIDMINIMTADDRGPLLPSFDVLQQGDEDLFNLPTIFEEIGSVFRGVFVVKKDNQSFHRDGLSFVIPHFIQDCSDLAALAAEGTEYNRDQYNRINSGILSRESLTAADTWATERDKTGKIKHSISIRGSEDPYFVFGDPNYRLGEKHE